MKKTWRTPCYRSFLALLVVASATGGSPPLQAQDRDSWQQPERVMDAIGVRSAMAVGEVGAGTGYFTFKLANRVGEAGVIYANDIRADVLAEIDARCREEGVRNIRTILGEVTDPRFPQNGLDLVFMSFVFHMLEEPVALLENLKAALRPGAPLVILEGRSASGAMTHGRGSTHSDPQHAQDQVVELARNAGFSLVRVETFLDRDNIYVFELTR